MFNKVSCEKLHGRLSYLCLSLRISDNLLHVCFGLDFIHLSLDIRQDCSL